MSAAASPLAWLVATEISHQETILWWWGLFFYYLVFLLWGWGSAPWGRHANELRSVLRVRIVSTRRKNLKKKTPAAMFYASSFSLPLLSHVSAARRSLTGAAAFRLYVCRFHMFRPHTHMMSPYSGVFAYIWNTHTQTIKSTCEMVNHTDVVHTWTRGAAQWKR